MNSTHLRLAATALGLALLAPPAHADKFYFAAPSAEAVDGAAPDFVEGVLVAERDGNYVIRVEGGEITVAKALVIKIERDDLTVDALVAREQGAAERLAAANEIRSEAQAAEAAARREARAVEAALEADAEAAAPAPAAAGGAAAAGYYDPIIGVYRGSATEFAVEQELRLRVGGFLRREYQRAFRELRRRLHGLSR